MTGPRAEIRACRCLGSKGMIAGSGMSAKPSEATEVSREGLSLKTKSTASRAPAAWSKAETMARAVCGKSRSAVISGPRSESASTVRSSRRKLFFWTAKHRLRPEDQSRKRVPCSESARHGACWLVWCGKTARSRERSASCGTEPLPGGRKSSKAAKYALEIRLQFGKSLHDQQLPGRIGSADLFVFQHPSLIMGDEHGVEAGGQRGIDVRLGTVADHPGVIGKKAVFRNH